MADRKTIYLVPCAARKRSTRAAARDLYTSSLFGKMRAVAERYGTRWFILSAKHGLLDPKQVIEPYDETLNKMRVAARRDWARRVQAQMEKRLPKADRIVVLAGKNYREYLMDGLRRHAPEVTAPLAHLGIGKQLQQLDRWLSGSCSDDAPAGGSTPSSTSSEPASGGASSSRGSKYDPLRQFLARCREDSVELKFSQVADLVGGLPRSAYAYRPWWANSGHVQARAWLDAGRQASIEWKARRVTFRRKL